MTFTNVLINCDGDMAEIDDVIINKYGVFIIEVKAYEGRLYDMENDYEWVKYKDDGYGNTFVKYDRNPIPQAFGKNRLDKSSIEMIQSILERGM